MRARNLLVMALVATVLVGPFAPARAAGANGAESRLGVLLMAACGFSAKAALIAPVPWAGVAVVTCGFGLLDAALSSDSKP